MRDCACGCTSNHVFTSKVRKLCLVRGPIDHFVSQIQGLDAIPERAELVARLHWPDEHANVVLLSVGVDRHVHCSLLQILRRVYLGEGKAKWTDATNISANICREFAHRPTGPQHTSKLLPLHIVCTWIGGATVTSAQRKLAPVSHSREFPLKQESSASKVTLVNMFTQKNPCREIRDVGASHSLLSVKIPRGAHFR